MSENALPTPYIPLDALSVTWVPHTEHLPYYVISDAPVTMHRANVLRDGVVLFAPKFTPKSVQVALIGSDSNHMHQVHNTHD